MGAVSYALLGLVGSALPGSPWPKLAVALGLASFASAIWYLLPNPRLLFSPTRQVARHPLVYSPVTGAVIFGGILGIGLITRIVTPLVWVGAIAVIARGSAFWGLAYGMAFGLGRTLQLFFEYLSNEPSASARVRRTVVSQGKLYRPVGFLVALGLLLQALMIRGAPLGR